MNIDPKNPRWEDRDWCVMSKGHAGPAMYATLGLKGFYPVEDCLLYTSIVMAQKGFFDYQEICETYGQVGSKFGQHPCKTRLPMLDASTCLLYTSRCV